MREPLNLWDDARGVVHKAVPSFLSPGWYIHCAVGGPYQLHVNMRRCVVVTCLWCAIDEKAPYAMKGLLDDVPYR